MGSFSGCPYLSGSDIGFDVRDNHVSYFYQYDAKTYLICTENRWMGL